MIHGGALEEGTPELSVHAGLKYCIVSCNMSDVPTLGNIFTWCNEQSGWNQTWQVLDRVLQSSSTLMWGGLSATMIHQECSDHAPILCPWIFDPESAPNRWSFRGVGTWPQGL